MSCLATSTLWFDLGLLSSPPDDQSNWRKNYSEYYHRKTNIKAHQGTLGIIGGFSWSGRNNARGGFIATFSRRFYLQSEIRLATNWMAIR